MKIYCYEVSDEWSNSQYPTSNLWSKE
jgi:hypothetical protein